MIKRFFLSLAILAGLLSPAYSAGTIPWSLSQQLDALGKPLTGCKLYIYAAGTTTPQNAYQDTALTNAWPNPLTCDSAGRLPQFFLADGLVKIRITDKNGVTQAYAGQGQIDNILVIGPSSGGGGGGGSIDPTTIMATGDLKVKYGTGVLTGFVRANGRTIGSATSGAAERANADCQPLFEYLWNSDPNLTVSTGRGASANADWVANKTITLPDMRGRAPYGMDDMGNTNSLRLSGTLGSLSTTLGGAGGANSAILSQGNLPAVSYNLVGTNAAINVTSTANNIITSSDGFTGLSGSAGLRGVFAGTNVFAGSIPSTGTFTPAGTIGPLGAGGAFNILSPAMVMTIYQKL